MAAHSLRQFASTYVWRRIRSYDCLHIDVFIYPISYMGRDYYAVSYDMRPGGKGVEPIRQLVFMVDPLDWSKEPKQISPSHAALTDMHIGQPVLMTSRDKRDIAGAFTAYHHNWLRDIAVSYPVSSLQCKSHSIRFHYFTAPDHDPTQGFRNWFAPQLRRAVHG